MSQRPDDSSENAKAAFATLRQLSLTDKLRIAEDLWGDIESVANVQEPRWQFGVKQLLLLATICSVPLLVCQIVKLPIPEHDPLLPLRYALKYFALGVSITTGIAPLTGVLGWFVYGTRRAFVYGYIICLVVCTSAAVLLLVLWQVWACFLW